MTPPASTQSSISDLRSHLDQRFDEVRDSLKDIDSRVRTLETKEAGCSPLMGARIATVEKKVESHSTDITDLTKTVRDLAGASNRLEGILKWILGIFTAILIAVLIALVTGQAAIVFGK